MAIMQTSGESPKNLLRKDDEAWLKDVLDLIPRSVYGEDLTHASVRQNAEKSIQKAARTKLPGKKGVAKKGESMESNDDVDSRKAGLKRKLHEKILGKRAARKADEESYVEARAARKRKREEKSSSSSREPKGLRADRKRSTTDNKTAKTTDPDVGSERENIKRKLEGEDLASNSISLETTRVAGFDNDKPVRKAKRRKLKGSKLRELQKKLEEANKAKEVVQRKSDTRSAGNQEDEGKAGDGDKANVNDSRNREMEKAMQRAQGMDVKDDVKKLKKSIRREKRKTEKSREDWAKRKKTLEMERKAKQEKRARNLEERKGNKGASRKKKL